MPVYGAAGSKTESAASSVRTFGHLLTTGHCGPASHPGILLPDGATVELSRAGVRYGTLLKGAQLASNLRTPSGTANSAVIGPRKTGHQARTFAAVGRVGLRLPILLLKVRNAFTLGWIGKRLYWIK
jgi:hypothetical protein